MIANIECLIEACKDLKISYSFLDKNKNCVQIVQHRVLDNNVRRPASNIYFINASNPLNDEAVAVLAKDKEFTYRALKNVVKMPETKAYFDPAHLEYGSYKTFQSQEEIVLDIMDSFTLPIMIKRNRGARTSNVFISKTKEDVEKSIATIFNQKSKDYDYVALAQTYIPSTVEYRVIVLDGKIELVYEKNLDTANPKQVTEKSIIEKLQNFVAPIFKIIPLRWGGLDIILGTDGNLYLLELNSKPGFGYFLQNHDKKIVIEIYKKILQKCNV